MILTPNFLSVGFLLCTLVSFNFFIVVVQADLKYYIYLEEESVLKDADINKNINYLEDNTAGEVIVLESVGSLPFEKSSYSADGDTCPSMVSKAGGINAQYLCVGSNQLQKESIVFFPIAPTTRYDSTTASHLPLRFGALTESHGASSGLLLWRNALAVDWPVSATSLNALNTSLNGISFGKDTSRDLFNTEWLRSTTSSYQDGEVVAEWHLLSESGGDPILNGGSLQLIKGKPSPSLQQEQLSDDGDKSVTDTVSVADYLPNKASAISCQSIAQTLCSENNNEKYGTMCSLMMQVGLDDVLSSSGSDSSYTLYAPTNEAFSRTFGGKAPPALLSGHDLTKLLLSHIIVGNSNESSQSQARPGQIAFRYEKMVCGAKRIMASMQVTKIGCDANAEISYVIGAGNQNIHKPSFLDVDHETCNGVIHTLDYVILPSSKESGDQAIEHQHDHYVVDIDTTAGPGEEQTSTNKNNLDKSDIASFFKEDMGGVKGAVDEKEIALSKTVTTKTNEGDSTFEQNDLRPVTQKNTNSVFTPQVKEQPQKSRDDKTVADNNGRQLGLQQRRATTPSVSEKRRQGHLRSPR